MHFFQSNKDFFIFRMADFFLDEPAAAPAAQVSDPAADFLAGEQADLAAIDNSANVLYDQVATEGGFEEVEPDSDEAPLETNEEIETQPAEQSGGNFSRCIISFGV